MEYSAFGWQNRSLGWTESEGGRNSAGKTTPGVAAGSEVTDASLLEATDSDSRTGLIPLATLEEAIDQGLASCVLGELGWWMFGGNVERKMMLDTQYPPVDRELNGRADGRCLVVKKRGKWIDDVGEMRWLFLEDARTAETAGTGSD